MTPPATLIRALVGFELTRRRKVVSTYVYALVLFAAGFVMMLAAGGVFSGVAVSTGNERVLINGPHSLFTSIGVISLFGLFTVAAIFGQAAYQDFGHDTWSIVFTKNVRKAPYLAGRFLGAYVFSCLLFLAIGLGQLAGTAVVWGVRRESLGPISPAAYLWPYLTQVWPMLLFTGAVFFGLAATTRKMAPVYVGVVVLVLGYLLTTTLVQDVDSRVLAALLDPFGFNAYGLTTRYWTPAEQNRDLAPMASLFGLNRAIWSGAALGLLGLAIRRFRTGVEEHRGRGREDTERSQDTTPFPTTRPSPSTSGWVRAASGFGWMYFVEIVRSAVFWALIASAVILGTVIVLESKSMFGTTTIPVTYQALELTVAAFRLFALIIVTFYAGELVWRERDVRANDIVDATSAPTWVGYLGKLGALFLVALSVEGATALVTVVSQISRGYFAIEGRLYLTELLLIDFTGLGLACVLAFVVQVIVNHKYLGHAVMVGYFVLRAALAGLGVEDPLWRYGSDMPTKYSDMNGYGHLLGPFVWLRVYWWGLAIALVVVGYVFFVRGRETRLAARFALGRRRLGVPARLAFSLGLVVFVSAGSFIFYNTHVLNAFRTEKDQERDQALYEKTYKGELAKLAQPSVVGVDTSFDLFPETRSMMVRGTYRLENKGTEPVSSVALDLPDTVEVRELRIGDAKATFRNPTDEKLGVRFVTLPQPLAPSAQADLVFDLAFVPKGFSHEARLGIVDNGTFVNNALLPQIGYDERLELESDRDRQRYDLAPKERMAPRDGPNARAHNYIKQDSDFVSFATTVSTSPDQIAMAPGYLEREWMEGGRRYFRYVMDQPILNFFSVLSARYAVKRDEWNGVKLEILHHPTHTRNLDRMMLGMKDALAYCSEAFGPYQHRQARILEFPRYLTFAQSFPNTIPYSEAVGFIARVRDDDPDDVDYPYYVTAHEIAHQWWAHQVVGANVRGATMTSESMAQYSALMVMKKKYGKERMRRYLKFELDGYLRGRFVERKKELPLAHNENQPYIHYQKSTIAMWALHDYIGEERVNRALANVVSAWRQKGPPYATSKDLVDAFRAETPPEYQYLIDDLFETITLYDNRTLSAKATKNADGSYEVVLQVFAKKVRSDDKGDERELDFEDFIDVGALDDLGTAIMIEKRRVRRGESEIRIVVPKKPAKVGIDPLNGLVDRDSDDNVVIPSF